MIHIFIDTNKLFDAGMGMGHSDFRRLLLHSKEGEVKLYIPYICWEERRTQIFDDAMKKNKALLAAHSEFTSAKNLFLEPIPKTPMFEIDEESLKLKSREIMAKFAEEYGIEILAIAEDHAQRAWTRYFETHPPFNKEDTNRENRRKDIPDSWILEAAIDLKDRCKELFFFGNDGKLTKAIGASEITVIKEYKELFEKINSCIAPSLIAVEEINIEETVADELEKALLDTQQSFVALEKIVLGYIAYLDPITKEELFDTLSKRGIGKDISENIAEKLVFTDVITDSGNYYLIKNKSLCDLAAKEVEDEISQMLTDDKS